MDVPSLKDRQIHKGQKVKNGKIKQFCFIEKKLKDTCEVFNKIIIIFQKLWS